MPVLNEAPRLKARAAELLRLPGDVELIVVDGGSVDGTVSAANELGAQLMHSAPGRALQMNAGATTATGQYLIFLHADTSLPVDFVEYLSALTTAAPDWGFFTVKLSPSSPMLRVVERFMNWRSRLTAVATGDQTLFVRRATFTQIGGYAEIPLMEDVELSKRLRRLARPWIWSTAVETDSRRWRKYGVLRTILLMWSLRLQFVLGVAPERLHRQYYGR